LDDVSPMLTTLSTDCNFKAVNAEQNREDFVREAFINGLLSNLIRQRLLESPTLELQAAHTQAVAFDRAQRNSISYNVSSFAASTPTSNDSKPASTEMVGALQKRQTKKCFFCGGSMHKRYDCPAKESECYFCHKTGHFAKVCQLKSKAHSSTAAPLHSPFLATVISGATPCLTLATADAMINETRAQCLLESGASECFIDEAFVTQYNLQHKPSCKKMCMASTSFSVEVKDSVKATVTFHEQTYKDVRFGVVKDLCADAVLGHDFMRLHDSVIFQMCGDLDPLVVGQYRDPLVTRQDGFCCVSEALVNPPRIFPNLTPNF